MIEVEVCIVCKSFMVFMKYMLVNYYLSYKCISFCMCVGFGNWDF